VSVLNLAPAAIYLAFKDYYLLRTFSLTLIHYLPHFSLWVAFSIKFRPLLSLRQILMYLS